MLRGRGGRGNSVGRGPSCVTEDTAEGGSAAGLGGCSGLTAICRVILLRTPRHGIRASTKLLGVWGGLDRGPWAAQSHPPHTHTYQEPHVWRPALRVTGRCLPQGHGQGGLERLSRMASATSCLLMRCGVMGRRPGPRPAPDGPSCSPRLQGQAGSWGAGSCC